MLRGVEQLKVEPMLLYRKGVTVELSRKSICQ